MSDRVRAVLLLGCLLALGACTSGSSSARSSVSRTELAAYLHDVEPLRLGVNDLLEGAEPILGAYREGRITGVQAQQQMQALEHRFALYEHGVLALRPANTFLRSIHEPYAHTYVQEDAYLRALASALPSRSYARLPRTAGQQREKVAVWREHLETVARRLGYRLPADLHIAGRGEIAPDPNGS
ncbi:MAG TPA: hypothetical protein VIC35_08355 [Acidimicrobiia bacterium]|jgi:hypothetical protein